MKLVIKYKHWAGLSCTLHTNEVHCTHCVVCSEVHSAVPRQPYIESIGVTPQANTIRQRIRHYSADLRVVHGDIFDCRLRSVVSL